MGSTRIVANRDIAGCVRAKERFRNTNDTVFSTWETGRYAVFSYGYHFPVAVYDEGHWYLNVDKFSPTTSRHQTHVFSGCEGDCKRVDTDTAYRIFKAGIVQTVGDRITSRNGRAKNL